MFALPPHSQTSQKQKRKVKNMLCTGMTGFHGLMSLISISGLVLIVRWFLKSPKKSEYKKEYEAPVRNTPEQNIAQGIQGTPCRICGSNTGLYYNSDTLFRDEDLICPQCKKLYRQCSEDHRYPPEIIEFLEEYPEYEKRLSPEAIMNISTWVQYRKLERRLTEGNINHSAYQAEYNELLRQHKDNIYGQYLRLTEQDRIASRPKYDPTRDSKF